MKPAEPVAHGFKRITLSNWKEMDDIIQFSSPGLRVFEHCDLTAMAQAVWRGK